MRRYLVELGVAVSFDSGDNGEWYVEPFWIDVDDNTTDADPDRLEELARNQLVKPKNFAHSWLYSYQPWNED